MLNRHTCHARGCEKAVPRKMLMCGRHWAMVPTDLKLAVWAVYVPGQEERMNPTDEYLKVSNLAIEAVAKMEGP